MKTIILSFICLIMLTFSNASAAISVVCKEGPFRGMRNTAYCKVRTTAIDFIPGGYFYAMAISTDFNNNIRGQFAGGARKYPFSDKFADIWLLRIPIEGELRRLRASGGVAPWTGKVDSSRLTPIVQ
jgi:hypothetical protein